VVEHFFGPVVVLEKAHGEPQLKQFVVIDGQQRLTTQIKEFKSRWNRGGSRTVATTGERGCENLGMVIWLNLHCWLQPKR
jgi:hypothetical protein